MCIPLLILLLVLPCGWARIVNVTIDDRNGDELTGLKPKYTDSWYTWTEDPPKNVSQMWDIDLSQVHDRTLSQAGFQSGNVTLRFKGTAIYVFFVVSTTGNSGLVGDNRLAFYLDDGPKPVRTYSAANFTDWQYNHLVFESGPLAQRAHALIVENDSQMMFFDYAVYTTDTESNEELDAALPETSSALQTPTASPTPLNAPSPTGRASASPGSSPSAASPTPSKPHGAAKFAKVVVPVIGGAALFAAFCSWSLLRRRRRRGAQGHTTAWQEPVGMDDPADDASANTRPEKALTPYAAQPQLQEKPDTAVPKQRLMDAVLGPKESDDTGGRIAPLPLPDLDASPGPNINGRPRTGPKRRAILEMLLALDPVRPAPHVDEARGESTVEIRAELERLRAEAEEARAENEMLRQAVEPPPYSDGGRSESGSVLVRGGRL